MQENNKMKGQRVSVCYKEKKCRYVSFHAILLRRYFLLYAVNLNSQLVVPFPLIPTPFTLSSILYVRLFQLRFIFDRKKRKEKDFTYEILLILQI